MFNKIYANKNVYIEIEKKNTIQPLYRIGQVPTVVGQRSFCTEIFSLYISYKNHDLFF